MGKRIAVIFDYDFTLIDCNSDTYVFEQLWPSRPEVVQELYTNEFKQWTLSMDKAFELYYEHDPDASRETILSTVAQVPVQEKMLDAIRYCHSLADLFIVSDANTDFIHSFLEKEGLNHVFTRVISNKPISNMNGRFGVAPFYDFLTQEPHGCPLQCPPNMCKGKILEEELQIFQTYERVVYLGDGLGDFCPCHRLRETDFALARTDFPLAKHIQENPIAANVHFWQTGEDVHQLLTTLVVDARLE